MFGQIFGFLCLVFAVTTSYLEGTLHNGEHLLFLVTLPLVYVVLGVLALRIK